MKWPERIYTSIRWKLLAVFIAGLVLPTLAAAWISYREARNSLYRHSLGQQEKTINEISNELWALESQSRSQLLTLGTSPPTLDALRRLGPVPSDLIATFLKMNPNWRDLILYDAGGDPVWSSDAAYRPRELDPFFLETFGLNENQTPVFRKENAFCTRFGLRVSAGGDFAGVVSASLELSFLEQNLQRLRELRSVRAFLWDDRGIIFASNLTPSELREISDQIQPTRFGGQILNSPGKVQHREIRMSREPELLSGSVVPEFISPRDPIPGQNWFLAIVSPATQAFADLWAFQMRNLIFLGLLFSAASVVLWWMTNRVTAPLEEMSAFAEEVSKGKREIRLASGGRDEIAKLKSALNSLTSALDNYEKELVRQEVLASLGRMSSIVAHEIRNPLNTIKGAAQYLESKYASNPQIGEYSRIIREKVDNLSAFVNSLLRLARLPDPRLGECDIAELFEAALAPYRDQALRRTVAVELENNGIKTIRCDRDQMIELMQNVAQNALDALVAGGKFSVRVRRKDQQTEIYFQDNGSGLPTDMQDRVFVPFSTSKPQGTGLGLVICKMIAENHGGTFHYDAGAERGACFILTLPQ